MASKNRLRVYYGPQDELLTKAKTPAQNQRQTVSVDLETVLPLLADAMLSQRAWVKDFADDQVAISTDLYEVLLAYQHFRRPSA